ncbi:putative membrane protein [Natranaerovirga hydrolytica]|uniref:Putative membrane protein n=1 Tax=Natranaerovirga hydrolytica TaxID=680378 RepID=A0A4R1MLA7_9FIRM|nr:SdpI family protein [Natranaerovirga hydrolytica]TCK90613.1 putative membrane protein [Natranaerovirga hydrolytica]
MMKNKFILVLSIVSLIGTVIAYFYLPEQIIMHWDVHGEATRYDPKWMVLITGILPVIVYLGFEIIPKIDPKKENFKKHKNAYDIIRAATILLLIVIQWFMIAVAFGINISINTFVPLIVGIVFIVIGNYMPQFRHNYFVGIRTPWTLANEHVWKKTHQLGGYLFIVMGILFLIQIFIRHLLVYYFTFALIFIIVLYLTVYSYVEFKKTKK